MGRLRPCARLLRLLLLAAALALPAALPASAPMSAAELAAASEPSRVAATILSWPSPQPPYDLAMCVMVHNEARYILQWALYHYMLGFQARRPTPAAP